MGYWEKTSVLYKISRGRTPTAVGFLQVESGKQPYIAITVWGGGWEGGAGCFYVVFMPGLVPEKHFPFGQISAAKSW